VADETFDLVNEAGEIVGHATRAQCHSDPRLLHRAVHLFVFNKRSEVFLQKRSASKDIQPGKWDTSVGGHVALGESPADAVAREMVEEIGLREMPVQFLHQYLWRSPVESELVSTFRCVHEGPFQLDREEIEDGAFYSAEELRALATSEALTPNLTHELRLLGLLPPEDL
jgi:isopentenyl-diphosphate delta-isomerase type 1